MDDIVNLFTQEHGVYQEDLKFKVIIIFIIIIIFFTKFFSNYMGIIIVIAFALIMTNFYIKVNNNQINDNNKNLIFKLDSLQNKIYEFIQYKVASNNNISNKDKQQLFVTSKLDSLYIDCNLIVFLYSIIKLYDYNPNEYYLLLKGTNNILKLKKDIEIFYKVNNNYPENISEMLQVAIQLKTNCMNNLQNNIYKVPKIIKMYDYIDNSLIIYNKLISSNITQMNLYNEDYIRKNGVNIKTLFVDINSPKGFDPMTDHSIDPNLNVQKLIDLYH